jgi:tetratricopeptide (TPR) repeat protein
MLLRYSFLFLLAVGFCQANPICVALVVQNNEETIADCLNSVAAIADCISVCDIGSTDKTVEIIEEFLKAKGLPGKIHQRIIQDSSYTQLISAEAGKKTLKQFGFNLSTAYLLLLEPDQIVDWPSPLSEPFVKPSYLVLEKSWVLSSANYAPRLLRASLNAEDLAYYGKKWDAEKIRGLVIEDVSPLADTKDLQLTDEEKKDVVEARLAQYKAEKLNRNLVYYTEALQKDPDNPLALFYLAQSHKALKQYAESIGYYLKQAEKGSDRESVWFAKYMLGECYEEMGQWVHALYWYLEAYQFDPARGEPLRKIATYYRLQGKNNLAYIFAKHGLRLSKADEILFYSSEPLRDYQFDEELSISSFYTHFKEDGYAAVSDLLLRKDAPYYVCDRAYQNLLFYIQNIKARFVPIDIPLPLVNATSQETYHPMNPSLIKTEEGYRLICRSVNYTQTGAKHFHTNDAGGIFRTRNFLIDYDRSFQILAQREIIEDLDREHWRDHIVQGLEDCRLFHFQGSDWFTCSTFDTNPSGAIQISLCKIRDGQPVAKVDKLLPLKGPDPNRHEKNWLPFVKNGELFFIYSSDPFVIKQPNLETGECETLLHYEPTHNFSRFRGSASPIAFDNGYLMMVHEVILHADYTRCYVHRFVFLDSLFAVKKISKPFTFKHSGIEYCLSMVLDPESNQMIIPIGIEDQEAYLCFVDLDEIRSILQPLPPVYPPF